MSKHSHFAAPYVIFAFAVLAAGCTETNAPENPTKDAAAAADLSAQADNALKSTDQRKVVTADRGAPDHGRDLGVDGAAPERCAPGTRTGAAGNTDGLVTSAGTNYNVRTPQNYDPTKPHPLIVMIARGGVAAGKMEGEAKLTVPATNAGYIIAYVDDVSPDNATLVDNVAAIPSLIAQQWCIDTSRVYLTGHSNGGTNIYVMMARKTWTPIPAAIAPSAAGVTGKVLAQVPCPAMSMPVMVLHSSNDKLFPGFGKEASAWWVGCQKCKPPAAVQGNDAGASPACVVNSGCTNNVEVHYCEGNANHGAWPVAMNEELLDFFGRYRRAK